MKWIFGIVLGILVLGGLVHAITYNADGTVDPVPDRITYDYNAYQMIPKLYLTTSTTYKVIIPDVTVGTWFPDQLVNAYYWKTCNSPIAVQLYGDPSDFDNFLKCKYRGGV